MSTYDTFDDQKQFACRVIADHARATAFSITDGILPANEGRNYVLRKIMRRAIYQGRHTLGFDDLFFYKVTSFVVDQMGGAYPELEASREFIERMVKLEEERFGSTMTVGLKKLDEIIEKNRTRHLGFPNDTIPGHIFISDLAKLYDTFGTPIDLMYVVLNLSGRDAIDKLYAGQWHGWLLYRNDNNFFDVWRISEEEFRDLIESELKGIQQRSVVGKAEQTTASKSASAALARRVDVRSAFKGYETTRV